MKIEDLITENEKLLRFLNQTPLAIVEVDDKGNIILCNSYYSKLIEPIIGKNDLSNLFDGFSPFLNTLKDRFTAFEHEHGVIVENELCKIEQQNSECVYYNFNIIRNHTNSTMITFSDRTKEIAEKEKITLLGDAMTEIIHDLRNPLNIINTTLNLSNREPKNLIEMTKYHKLMKSSVEILLEYIRSLLDFSQGITYAKNENPLGPIIQEVAKLSTIRWKDLEIKIVPEIIQPKTITCDAKEIARAIQNLVNNSCKALIDQNIPNPSVRIQLTSTHNRTIIKIIDNGQPISKELKSSLLDDNVTKNLERKGLGFTIVKKIVKDHGGEVCIDSTPEGNSISMKFSPSQNPSGSGK